MKKNKEIELIRGDGQILRLKLQSITEYENNTNNYYKKIYNVSATYEQESLKDTCKGMY